MLIPQLHAELTSAAGRARPMRRASIWTARAVLAALATLLIVAPTAQAVSHDAGAPPAHVASQVTAALS
jgi:hypothetical protein